MEAAINSFLEYLERDKKYSKNTLLSYLGDLEQYRAYLVATCPDKTSASSYYLTDNSFLFRYLQSLRGRGYAVATVARKVASIKSFIRYLVDSGKLNNNLIPSISSPQVSKMAPKPLSVADIRLFLEETAKSNTVECKRDRAMLELLYATGLRASELMSLNLADVDVNSHCINCKSDRIKTRRIVIDEYIRRILYEYIRESRNKLVDNQNEVALFVNRRGERLTRQGFWQIIQGYADKVGLSKKITPRSIRNSFAAHKLKSGVDLHTMQELLGHAHISTTKVYQNINVPH